MTLLLLLPLCCCWKPPPMLRKPPPGAGAHALLHAGRLATSVGLVGLPNVGKSSLLNLLAGEARSTVGNRPFVTIDPVVTPCVVPDARLDALAARASSKKVLRDAIHVHDIAGLVKGASKGHGLGNAFLGNIRAVDAIVHVVRCFDDADVIHVDGEERSPERDVETIEMELVFADLESVERRLEKRSKLSWDAAHDLDLVRNALLGNKPAISVANQLKETMPTGLLTSKPILYALVTDNPTGDKTTARVAEFVAARNGGASMLVSTAIETQIANEAGDDEASKKELLDAFGVREPTPARFAREVARLLDRRVFFTVGPQEARAWAIAKNETAVQAASRIHTDIAKKFIAVEVTPWEQWGTGAPFRLEGAAYLVQDGDVLVFRHSAK